MDQTDRYAIEFKGIDKRFGDVYANRNRSTFRFVKAAFTASSAKMAPGKSTLMSIIYGFTTPTEARCDRRESFKPMAPRCDCRRRGRRCTKRTSCW